MNVGFVNLDRLSSKLRGAVTTDIRQWANIAANSINESDAALAPVNPPQNPDNTIWIWIALAVIAMLYLRMR